MDSKEFKNLGNDLNTSDNENMVKSVNLPMAVGIVEENESVQETSSPSEEATISTAYVAEPTEHTQTPNTKWEKLSAQAESEDSEERDGVVEEISEENESVQETVSPSEANSTAYVAEPTEHTQTLNTKWEKLSAQENSEESEEEREVEEQHGSESNESDEQIQLKKTKEIKDKERDIRSAPLSIPYFTLPKSSYLEFSENVSKKLTTNTESPKTHTRSNSETSILEEIANETAENSNCLPNLHQTIELNPNFMKEKLCESPSDDDIVILDVIPSPHAGAMPGTSSSSKGFCFHSASKKSCKPNLNFAGNVGMKKSVQSATSQNSEVPGAKWHYWKKELEKRINKKKEENFKKRKEIERIDDEEVFSEDEGTIGCEIEEFVMEEQKSSDGYNSEENDESQSEDSLSQFSDATVTDSEKSVAAEVHEGEFPRRSTAEDHSQICFSMPSHQPYGGFPELEDAVESSPYMKETVITLSSDSSLSSAASSLFVHENNFCMNSQEKENPTPTSFMGVNMSNVMEKEEREIIHTFDDDSILGICSGVFPSTNGVLPSTPISSQTQRSFPSEKIVCEAESQDPFTKAPENVLVKRRVISVTEEESSLSESESDDVESFSIHKKKKTNFNLSDDSEDDAVTETNFPFTEDIPDTNLMDAKKRNLIQDFIENEAELSGEEASSDEDEINLDIEEEMGDFFEDVPQNYEKLRNQIGQIHLKQIQDADDNFLKRVQNDFLDEGELHAEGGERKKTFSWASKDLAGEPVEAINLSDSDEDNVEHFNQEDKLKWKKEVSHTADNLPDEPTHEKSSRSASLKMNIIGKSNVCMSELKVDHSLKRKRGSLMHSEGLKVKKMREETPVGSRKQVFFIKNDQDNPKPSTSKDKGKKPNSVIFEKIFKN